MLYLSWKNVDECMEIIESDDEHPLFSVFSVYVYCEFVLRSTFGPGWITHNT